MAFPLFLDEDSVTRALIRALQARGLDVTNAVDAGKVGIGDLEQLEYATATGRVLFTYNIGDFFSLHTRFQQEGWHHGGLILAPQQRYLQRLVDETREALRSRRTIQDAVETVGYSEAGNWVNFELFHRRNVTAVYTELEWEE